MRRSLQITDSTSPASVAYNQQNCAAHTSGRMAADRNSLLATDLHSSTTAGSRREAAAKGGQCHQCSGMAAADQRKDGGGEELSGMFELVEQERRRETAFKAVMLFSLCFSVCVWASLLTVCPVLYQFLSISSTQFDGMLQFCEETAYSASAESVALVDSFAQRRQQQQLSPGESSRYGGNGTWTAKWAKNRSFRQAVGNFQGMAEKCRCEPSQGAPGMPGRRGMKGTPGTRGAAGIPARLPCEPLQDLKKYCPEKCPHGLQGTPGQRGPPGEKGKPGLVGPPGKNGDDGKLGPRGMPGPPGVPGLDGEDGDPGTDMQPTSFVPGAPGPAGEVGDGGPPGPRGLPGVDGPLGPQGRKGAQGNAGKMGSSGMPGPTGPIGDPGGDGHKGVCPTYCAVDGGVFFVEPPD